jgi:hypothetical protein
VIQSIEQNMNSSQIFVPTIVTPVTPQELAIKNTLSSQRLTTFEVATSVLPKERGALALYAWNAQVSATMLAPLHICEVTIRNAVSDAISAVYGSQWPWHSAFIGSLPNSGKWKMRSHLAALATAMPSATTTTGKLIPEINFVFWEKMFTGRFDAQIWIPHLFSVLPNLNQAYTIQQARFKINQDLLKVRRLRNRIAHHEPILAKNLNDDFATIKELIGFRCLETATWMDTNQQASALIALKPL